jgi:ribonuclease HI
MPTRPLKLFFDGGCRPNPGRMESAVVVRGVLHHRDDLGYGDNSAAEWLAAIYAVEVAQALGEMDIILIGDSRLVVRQASGLAPCRSATLREYQATFKALATGFTRLRVRQVNRHQNLAGIALDKLRN